jgi:hypothetical protein
MLEIAFGLKDAQAQATENPFIAMLAIELEEMRATATEDEFLNSLAKFALNVSAMSIQATTLLCLDENQQAELEKTILEIMEMDKMGE